MSDFDSNPFADPEAANPFSDPSVRQATHPGQHRPAGLDDYNPFADQQTTTRQAPSTAAQPAIMTPTESPPPYTPTAAQEATANLQARQEELERKAAELEKKEQDLTTSMQQGRMNNFPPLPERCCVQPCFYQDFSVDIPVEFQRIVKITYYFWLFYSCTLLLNVLASLAYFIASAQGGVGNGSGVTFGLSILFFVLFTPCSFICWYRPLYKAFRSDSSFNFFAFFFIFFFQFCVSVIQCVGIDQLGTSGWINGAGIMTSNKAVGGIMMIVAGFFTLIAVGSLLILIRVHRIYRSTGASFDKAKQEFSQGVLTNPTVQETAGNAAAAGAKAAVQQNMRGNRY